MLTALFDLYISSGFIEDMNLYTALMFTVVIPTVIAALPRAITNSITGGDLIIKKDVFETSKESPIVVKSKERVIKWRDTLFQLSVVITLTLFIQWAFISFLAAIYVAVLEPVLARGTELHQLLTLFTMMLGFVVFLLVALVEIVIQAGDIKREVSGINA